MITAHAGAEETNANTLESLIKLSECGADAVECDVRERDGELFLSHNELEPGKDYATLEDAFKIFAPHEGLKVNIDLKTEGLVPSVDKLAKKSGMDGRVVFTGSAGESDISYIVNNGLQCWYNAERLDQSEWDAPLKAVEQKGLYAVNAYYRFAQARLSDNDPTRFSVWTVDGEGDLREFLKAGVLNITTRAPVFAIRLRDEIQKP